MSAFLSSLDIRVLDDCGPRPKIMTLEPFHYQSDVIGTIVVPRFYTFDGASIPQLAMSITGWPGIRAACLHDWLLETGVSRSTADAVFGEALAACGVDEGTAQIMYDAVRAYSAIVTAPRQEPDPATDLGGVA